MLKKRKSRKSKAGPARQMLTEVLIEARIRAGLTQRDLSARLERPQSFLAKIEGGLRTIDVIEFIEVSRALNVEPTKLLAKVIKKTGL